MTPADNRPEDGERESFPPPCPKCRQGDVYCRYREEGEWRDTREQRQTHGDKAEEECFDLHCRTCGYDWIVALADRPSSTEAGEMRKALVRYGAHHPDCYWLDHDDHSAGCNCGWAQRIERYGLDRDPERPPPPLSEEGRERMREIDRPDPSTSEGDVGNTGNDFTPEQMMESARSVFDGLSEEEVEEVAALATGDAAPTESGEEDLEEMLVSILHEEIPRSVSAVAVHAAVDRIMVRLRTHQTPSEEKNNEEARSE